MHRKIATERYEQLVRQCLFHLEQPDFPVDATRITREASVGSHHAMARDNERDGIVPDSAAHSLRRHTIPAFFPGNPGSNFAISHCLAKRNGKHNLPDYLAEGRCTHVQFRSEVRILATEIDVQPAAGIVENREPLLLMLLIKSICKVLLSVEPKADESLAVTCERYTSKRRIVMPSVVQLNTIYRAQI